jgi:hypothetical protein
MRCAGYTLLSLAICLCLAILIGTLAGLGLIGKLRIEVNDPKQDLIHAYVCTHKERLLFRGVEPTEACPSGWELRMLQEVPSSESE